MSYRIRLDSKLQNEVRRIGADRLDAAMTALDEHGSSRDEAIHSTRKNLKKLRGLLRLVRSGAPDFYATENARLRDIARSLSGLRDAGALVETVDSLRAHISRENAPDALEIVHRRLCERRDRIAAHGDDLDARIKAAMAACRESRDAFTELKLEGKPRKVLSEGWGRIAGQARDALEECTATGDPAAFHDLRKRIKYHWMHVRLIEDVWPSSMKLRRREAKRLEAVLGDEHNLALLLALMESEPDAVGPAGEREILGRLAADRQAELRGVALAGARTLFREGPKAGALRVALLIDGIVD